MAEVNLRGVEKSFGATRVIKGIDLDIAHGEFVVFVGPSGCGKSTLLRMIAGWRTSAPVSSTWAGSSATTWRPRARGIAMVFQSYALYPHMTVYENVGFALRFSRLSRRERDEKIREVARILQMEELLDRKPAQLSGGQRQRVAIGRSIVRHPKAFLFDEPLSNLDASLRVDMRMEIARLHQDLGATMIYVTHDQVEAMTLADKIVVLDHGEVQQVGAPLELYHRPANLFVAGFIGSPKMNLLPVRRSGSDGRGIAVGSEDVATTAFPGPRRHRVRRGGADAGCPSPEPPPDRRGGGADARDRRPCGASGRRDGHQRQASGRPGPSWPACRATRRRRRGSGSG